VPALSRATHWRRRGAAAARMLSSLFRHTCSVPTQTERFSKRGPWIISSLGFKVRSLGRAGMEYAEADERLHVDAEALATNAFIVYVHSIPEPRRLEVQGNLTRAWRSAGFDVQLQG